MHKNRRKEIRENQGVSCPVFTAPEYEPFPEYESSTLIVSSVMSYESRVYEDGELPFYPIFEIPRDSFEEAFKYTQAAKELNELFEDTTWQWKAERRNPGRSFLLLCKLPFTISDLKSTYSETNTAGNGSENARRAPKNGFEEPG